VSAASTAKAARAAAARAKARARQQQAQKHKQHKAAKPTRRRRPPPPPPSGVRRIRQAPLPGAIRITSDDPKLDLNVRMAEGAPQLTGGFGGWELVQRPRQVSMTEWSGVEPYQLTVDVLFDGFGTTGAAWGHPEGLGVENDIYELMRAAHGDDDTPPGICRIHGIQLPADRWVIESLDFDSDSAIIRRGDRQRLRQKATIVFREWVPPHYLRVSKSALQGAKPKTKVITTKKGDTVAKVAHRAHCKWTDIRKLNPKVLPLTGSKRVVPKASTRLKPGQKLRVPIPPTHSKKKKTRPHSGKRKHDAKKKP
jgi:hypothetical protein